jgi:hypothetical protein
VRGRDVERRPLARIQQYDAGRVNLRFVGSLKGRDVPKVGDKPRPGLGVVLDDDDKQRSDGASNLGDEIGSKFMLRAG